MSTETIKTLFRPFLTLILVIAWLMFIVREISYPPMFQWLASICVLEWIGERGLKRFKELIR